MAGRETRSGAPGSYRRRLILFVLLDAVFVMLVLVPGVVYLFVLDHGLSERDRMLYVVALFALQALATAFLLWKFRILPGPQSDKRDAR